MCFAETNVCKTAILIKAMITHMAQRWFMPTGVHCADMTKIKECGQ